MKEIEDLKKKLAWWLDEDMANNTLLSFTRSGLLYSNNICQNALTTQAMAADTLRAHPWIISKAFPFTAMAAEVTTNIGATTFRMAVYADNGSCYPGALVSGTDIGTLSSATTGVKSAAISPTITLTPGLYWIATNSNGAATFRAHPAASMAPILGLISGGAVISVGWTVSFAYAAMPSTFTAGGTIIASNAALSVAVSFTRE